MASPTLIFFLTAALGALLGFVIPMPLGTGIVLFVMALCCTLFVKSRFVRSMATCLGIVIGFQTVASHKRMEFDNQLASLSNEVGIYEGELIELSTGIGGDKFAKVVVHASSSSTMTERLAVSLLLKNEASAVQVEIGDVVRIRGKIQKPRHALFFGDFDAYWYGLAKGVVGRMVIKDAHSIAIIQQGAQESSYFSGMQQSLRDGLMEFLSPRDAGLVLALIVGDIRLFDEEQKAEYRNIGASHLLAVSGLQVSMLGFIFFRFFSFIFLIIPWLYERSLARACAVAITIGLIWCFVLLCSSPPSAVRAGLMTTLVLIAGTYGWRTKGIDVLSASGLIILTFSVTSVLDPSLWLSFSAVFGLIYAAAIAGVDENDIVLLNPHKTSSPIAKKIRASVLSSFGAGLFTLPFGIYFFGEIAPSGLIINLFLVPIASLLQTPAIVFAGLGIITGWSWLLHVSAFFAGVLDSICMSLNSAFGEIILTPGVSLFGLLGLLSAALVLLKGLSEFNAKKIAFGSFCALVVFAPVYVSGTSQMRVTFLPVGQGDAAVVEFPRGEILVVDGGGNYNNLSNPGERIIAPFLKRKHIKTIDVIALSHPDGDHLLGLLSLFDHFRVHELWHNEKDSAHPLMKMLIDKAIGHNTKIRFAGEMPHEFTFGDAHIKILSPSLTQLAKVGVDSTNNRSLVFNITYRNKRVLFTGDIGSEIENLMLENEFDVHADVVKVAHHGSMTSSHENFVKASKAEHAVFCAGVENKFKFPHLQVLRRWQKAGAHTWNTAHNGQITFVFQDHGIDAEPFVPID